MSLSAGLPGAGQWWPSGYASTAGNGKPIPLPAPITYAHPVFFMKGLRSGLITTVAQKKIRIPAHQLGQFARLIANQLLGVHELSDVAVMQLNHGGAGAALLGIHGRSAFRFIKPNLTSPRRFSLIHCHISELENIGLARLMVDKQSHADAHRTGMFNGRVGLAFELVDQSIGF